MAPPLGEGSAVSDRNSPQAMAGSAVYAGLAQGLLAGLAPVFPVTDLFWEECLRSVVSAGADPAIPGVTWRRGLQLRIVGRHRAASAWTTDLSHGGLLRAFDALASGVEPPRSLPPWPVPRWTVADGDEIAEGWREWAAGLVADVRRRLSRRLSMRASIMIERFLRGAAPMPDQVRTWSGKRVYLVVEADDGTGGGRPYTEVVGEAPRDSDRDRCVRAVLEALAPVRARRGYVSGLVPVVLAPGTGALVFHEIVGHALEADRVLAGASPLSAVAPGTRISHAELTVRDSPDPRWGPAGLAFDDEGQPVRDVTLIDRGHLAGLLHDRATAYVSGADPTGNGRRASFEFEPAPRMRNLVVQAGSTDRGDVLEGIRRGLYVERVSGSVDPSTRSFDLVVESGRIISRGACGERVRGVHIRGDTRQALGSIRAVGRDLTVSSEPVWCGRRGTVLTGVAGPTILMGPLEVLS